MILGVLMCFESEGRRGWQDHPGQLEDGSRALQALPLGYLSDVIERDVEDDGNESCQGGLDPSQRYERHGSHVDLRDVEDELHQHHSR